MDNGSGVGVLDKAALVLAALEAGPSTLAGLVAGTGLARPTAHRLAVALEHHRLVARDMQGRFVLGPRLSELSAAAGEDRLLAAAHALADRICANGARATELTKRAMLAPADRHPAIELELQAELFDSDEKRRRVTAFLERRSQRPEKESR